MDAGQQIRRDVMTEHLAVLSMLKAGEIQRLTDTAQWMRQIRLGKSLHRRKQREAHGTWYQRPRR